MAYSLIRIEFPRYYREIKNVSILIVFDDTNECTRIIQIIDHTISIQLVSNELKFPPLQK